MGFSIGRHKAVTRCIGIPSVSQTVSASVIYLTGLPPKSRQNRHRQRFIPACKLFSSSSTPISFINEFSNGPLSLRGYLGMKFHRSS